MFLNNFNKRFCFSNWYSTDSSNKFSISLFMPRPDKILSEYAKSLAKNIKKSLIQLALIPFQCKYFTS